MAKRKALLARQIRHLFQQPLRVLDRKRDGVAPELHVGSDLHGGALDGRLLTLFRQSNVRTRSFNGFSGGRYLSYPGGFN